MVRGWVGKNFKMFMISDIDYVDYYCNGRRKWKKREEDNCQKLNNILHFNFMNIYQRVNAHFHKF
jgi:hypothetical protein